MRRLQLIAFALATIVFASAAGAQGQDARKQGPVEIDRCQTISEPGSYKLVDDLIAQQGSDCLTIAHPGGFIAGAGAVTIDLAGFSITPTSIAGGTAINVSPTAGFVTVVRNGAISGFATAVQGATVVEGLTITGCQACAIGITDGSVVRNNMLTSLRNVGISATGLVANNIVSESNVGIFAGAGSTVIGNISTGNLIAGISVSCPSNVINNTAISNPQATTVNHSDFNPELNGTGCNSTNNVAP